MRIEAQELIELFGSVPYAYNATPDTLQKKESINCLTLTQYLLHTLYKWPINPQENFTGKLIFEDTRRFVPASAPFQAGDIFLFGPAHLQDLHKLHIAVALGINTPTGLPLLIHASNLKPVRQQIGNQGGIVCWNIQDFFRYPKYQWLYGIKRVKKTTL
jgi:hypothetical protein